MSNTVVRTLRIESEERGAAQVAAALDKVAGSAAAADAAVAKYQADSSNSLGAAAAPLIRSQEAFSKATLATASSMDVLRKRVDPVYKTLKEFEVAQRKTSLAIDAGTVSAEEGARTVGLYEARYQKAAAAAATMGGALAGVNDNTKLTSTQMLNLSRQGNDVITMFALGANPMQIFASQAGQIYDALESGPQGLTGSLKAVSNGVGGFLSSFGPIIGVVAAVTAATGAYFYEISSGFPDADTTLKKHDDALKAIEARYGSLSDRVKNLGIGGTGPNVLAGGALRDLARLQEAQAQAMERQLTGSDGIMGRIGLAGASAGDQEITPGQTPTLPKFAPIRHEVDALRATIDHGGDGIAVFQLHLEEMYRAAGDNDELKQAIEAASKFGDTLAATAANAEQLRRAVLESSAAYRRMSTDSGQFKTAIGGLAGAVPDTRTDRSKVDADFGIAMSKAKTEDDERRAIQLHTAALGELDRQEGVIRQGRALDLRAVFARTAADQALIATEREHLALSGTVMSADERHSREIAAGTLVFAQAIRSADDALRSSTQARAAAGLEGYAAAVTSITQRYQEQINAAQGSAEAIAKLTQARKLDIEALQLQTQKQLFEPQQSQLAGLKAEAAALGASDDQRRRLLDGLKAEDDLRRAGIDAISAQGEAYRKNAVALSDYEDRVRRTGEAYDDLRKTGENAIDGLVDSLTSGDFSGALKSIADDFTKTALQLGVANPLKNALLGTSYGTISDLFHGPGAAPTLGMPAMQAVGSMQVTAATVNIGGAALAGATGLLGGAPPASTNGGAGAITRLLNPANSNASGGSGVLDFVGNYKSGVNAKLTDILEQAAQLSGQKVDAFSGYRPGDSRFHGKGLATDVRLFGADGNPLANYQDADTFRQYEQFAQVAKQVQSQKYPELDDQFRWGGYFGGGKGKYGAMDAMHFDLGGSKSLGMAGGSWAGGLNSAQRGLFPGVDSVGMAQTQLATTTAKLADSASAFQTNFDQTINGTLIGGLAGVADKAAPGLGGVVSTLFQALSGGQGGGVGGGFLSSIFGGGAAISAGTRSAIMGGAVGAFANGTDSAPGGMAWVGEKGPELMNLPRGAQIVPNHVLANMSRSPQSAPNISQTFINAPPVKSQTDEPDGKGGRRQVIVFDEMTARSVGRQGSMTAKAIGQGFGLKKGIQR